MCVCAFASNVSHTVDKNDEVAFLKENTEEKKKNNNEKRLALYLLAKPVLREEMNDDERA